MWLLDLLLSWYGVSIWVVILIAVLVFVPGLRKFALMGIAAMVAAKTLEQRGANRKQKEWTDAEHNSIDRGRQARADAERDVAAEPDGVSDPFDRDNERGPVQRVAVDNVLKKE